MTERRSDEEVTYLLARGQLGHDDKQRVLRAVLPRAQDARRKLKAARRTRWVFAGATALAGLAAAVLLWVRPPSTRFEFAAKGEPRFDPMVAVTCAGASLDACPRGSTLVFSVTGLAGNAFVSAYAEPAQGRGGSDDRIWYFGNDAVARGPAPAAGAATPTQVLPRAARIGLEHAVARYHVHVIVSARPMSRAEVVELVASAASPTLTGVATRSRFQLRVTAP